MTVATVALEGVHAMTMKPVLHSFGYCVDFVCEQVADIAATDMVAQPAGIMNHPAWVIGHLTYACHELGGAIGLPQWLPKDWTNRFGTGSVPVADVGVYENRTNALAMLREAESRLTQAVEELDESGLDQPFPDESYRVVFPTIRHALTQVLVGHAAYHIGQLTIWRKAMGLPRMGRAFD